MSTDLFEVPPEIDVTNAEEPNRLLCASAAVDAQINAYAAQRDCQIPVVVLTPA